MAEDGGTPTRRGYTLVYIDVDRNGNDPVITSGEQTFDVFETPAADRITTVSGRDADLQVCENSEEKSIRVHILRPKAFKCACKDPKSTLRRQLGRWVLKHEYTQAEKDELCCTCGSASPLGEAAQISPTRIMKLLKKKSQRF